MKKILLLSILYSIALAGYSQENRTRQLLDIFREQPTRIMVAAHRGNHLDHPENSLSAFQASIDQHIDILELDVRMTKDGELVVLHDDKVDRTTDGSGFIEEMLFADVQQLRLTHYGSVTTQHVPTLKETLKLTKGKIIVDLDFKSEGMVAIGKCYQLIKELDMRDQVLFFTYDHKQIPALRQLDPTIMIMPRARSLADIKEISLSYPECRVIHIDDSYYSDELGKQLQAKKIRVWANMLGKYDQLEMKKGKGYIKFKKAMPYVNIIQTDDPVRVRTHVTQ